MPIIETQNKNNYCSYLASTFDISTPTCYENESNKDPLLKRQSFTSSSSTPDEDSILSCQITKMGYLESIMRAAEYMTLNHLVLFAPKEGIKLDSNGNLVNLVVRSNGPFTIEWRLVCTSQIQVQFYFPMQQDLNFPKLLLHTISTPDYQWVTRTICRSCDKIGISVTNSLTKLSPRIARIVTRTSNSRVKGEKWLFWGPRKSVTIRRFFHPWKSIFLIWTIPSWNNFSGLQEHTFCSRFLPLWMDV